MIDNDDECGAVGGMRIGRGNQSAQRKRAPVDHKSHKVQKERGNSVEPLESVVQNSSNFV
jgi:hypothetical protein